MTSFRPGRAQDASATIRGYVYQAETTILRWLGLRPGEALQLECGEDIDRVTRAVGDTSTESRTLEQVKDVKARVTLRSSQALFAIVSYWTHRELNPELRLSFLYTTTAMVGHEKLTPLPGGAPGIRAWGQVRIGEVRGEMRSGLLAGIRSLLSGARKPAKLQQEQWTRFQTFLGTSSDEDLASFIQGFEWSCGQSELPVLRRQVLAAVAERADAEAAAVEDHYRRLFVHVFDVLSRAGPKQLSLDELDAKLAETTFSETQAHRLSALAGSVLAQASDLLALKGRVDSMEATQAAASEELRAHAEVIAGIIETDVLPADEPPPLPVRLCSRRDGVRAVMTQAADAAWIAVYGGYGTGKSQLAHLVARTEPASTLWVPLRGLDEAQAARRAVLMLGRAGGMTLLAPSTDGLARALRNAAAPRTVVLDDMPSPAGHGALADLLVRLTRACAVTGCRLISTSPRCPSDEVCQGLEPALYRRVQVPPFTVEEAGELLSAHGGPADLTPDRLTTVNACCHGHAVLLVAAARFFSARSWQIDADSLIAIMRGAHTQDLSLETVRRLVETVTGDTCRELLYRLCIAGRPLSMAEMRSIALLEPAHPRFVECVSSLDGLWLQQTADGRFEVSPVVQPIGASQLPAPVTRRVHLAAAAAILARRRLGLLDVWGAAAHLLGADDHDRVASLLLFAHGSSGGARHWEDPVGLLAFYPPARPLPSSLNTGLAVQLRASQARVAAATGRDPGPYIREAVNRAMTAAPKDEWALVSAGLLFLEGDGLHNLPLSLTAAAWVEQFAPGALGPRGHPLKVPLWGEGAHYWLAADSIRSWSDLFTWMNAVTGLPPPRQHAVLWSESGLELMLSHVDRLWIASAEGAQGAPSLEEATRQLERLRTYAKEHGLPYLYACATRGRMVIEGEYGQRYAQVRALAAEAWSVVPERSPAWFVVKATLGQQEELAGEHAEALRHLRDAVAVQTSGLELSRMFALLTAAEAASVSDASAAALLAEEAMPLLSAARGPAKEIRVRMHAEVALARWNVGRHRDAFDALEAAVSLLLEPNPSDQLTALHVLVGSMTGFFLTVLATGAPPTLTDEGEPYSVPRMAMFRGFNSRLKSLYERRKKHGGALLMAHLAGIASALDIHDRAVAWADAAYEHALKMGSPPLVLYIAPDVADALCARGDMDGAIDAALMAGRSLVMVNRERAAGRDPLREDHIVDLRKPGEGSDPDEDGAAASILVPILLSYVVRGELDRALCQSASSALAAFADRSSDPQLWRQLAQVFEQVGGDWQALVEGVRDAPAPVRIAANLITSARGDVPPQMAAVLQLTVLPALMPSLLERPARGRLAFGLSESWLRRLREQRFAFGSPGIVSMALEEARPLEPVARLKATLRAVTSSLAITHSSTSRRWVETTAQ